MHTGISSAQHHRFLECSSSDDKQTLTLPAADCDHLHVVVTALSRVDPDLCSVQSKMTLWCTLQGRCLHLGIHAASSGVETTVLWWR
jgi:hypothetical protein